jgi:hypothetical protein
VSYIIESETGGHCVLANLDTMLDQKCGNYLMHFGRSKKDGAPIGSGRYPLGSGLMSSIKKHKADKKRAKALEEARKAKHAKYVEKNKKANFEANKEQILRGANAKQIYANRMYLNDNELNSALNRIDNDRKLANIVKSQEPSIDKKIDHIMNTVGKASDWAEKGAKGWNTFVAYYNSLYADENSKLPKIQLNGGGNKKK